MDSQPKKLVYVSLSRLPTEKAHGLNQVKMCEAFAQAGWDVLLIHPWRRNPIREDIYAYYNVEKNFSHREVFCGNLFSPYFRFFQAWFLSRTATKEKASLYYTRQPLLGYCLTHSRNPVALELHRMYNKLGVTIEGLKGAFCTTRWLAQQYPGSNVLPSGVDLDEFLNPVGRVYVRRKPVTVGYVGSHGFNNTTKGSDTFIRAACGLPISWSLTQGLSRIEAVQKLYTLDACVVPPPEDIEHFLCTSPTKLFEAMAAGTPVIAARMPGTNFIKNVLKVPASVDGLIWGIEQFMNMKDAGRAMALAARKEVESYTWDARVEKVLKVIGDES